MGKYVLTLQAEEDLIGVVEQSTLRFGSYQADAYYEGLFRTFGLIADFPGIGVASDEFRLGLRRFRFQSHYVYYSIESGFVLIRSLLHVRRLPRKDLFE